MGLGEEAEVRGAQLGRVNFGFAGHGAEASVGVLEIWASVAFEGCHVI